MCRKRAGRAFRAKHALGLDPWVETGRIEKRVKSRIWSSASISSKPRKLQIARSAVQHTSSMKERTRGAGRNASVGLGSSGMIVMVHAAGTLDLFSTIDRT
jgi:hypothetical protein